MKRLLVGLLVVLVLGVGAGVYVWQELTRPGGSDLEQWLARRIVGVLQGYLIPTVEFARVEYQPPRTLVLEGLKLTAGERDIIAVERARLELAAIPARNQPVRIARIELAKPRVGFYRDPQAGFVGWSPFVKPSVAKDPQSVPAGQRLSDLLVLESVTIRDGELEYDNLGDDTPPMILPGLTLTMAVEPQAGDPGWYQLDSDFRRDPVFAAVMDARLNLDTALLDVASLKIETALAPGQYESLPPDVQVLLSRHEVQARVDANLAGQLPLKDPSAAVVTLDATMTDVRLTLDQTQWDARHIALQLALQNAVLEADVDAELLGGTTALTTQLHLAADRKLAAHWDVAGVRIERALRTMGDAEPSFAGALSSQGQLATTLAALLPNLGGGGTLQIREGRLVNLPVITAFAKLLEVTPAVLPLEKGDQADVEFTLHPDRVEYTRLELVSSVVAVRGTGSTYYDGHLDMLLNAGMMERVQKSLGKLGDVFGALTDKMIKYRVTGPRTAPRIEVLPLGVGGGTGLLFQKKAPRG